jgi:hypothetical protein
MNNGIFSHGIEHMWSSISRQRRSATGPSSRLKFLNNGDTYGTLDLDTTTHPRQWIGFCMDGGQDPAFVLQCVTDFTPLACITTPLYAPTYAIFQGPNPFNYLNWNLYFEWYVVRPRARSHLCLAGLRPSHASFNARFSCPHLLGNSSLLGINVTITGQNYKFSSLHYFHYSQVNWWSSFKCQWSLSYHAFIDLSDWVLSHWFPTRRSCHAGAGKKTGQWRRCGKGGT